MKNKQYIIENKIHDFIEGAAVYFVRDRYTGRLVAIMDRYSFRRLGRSVRFKEGCRWTPAVIRTTLDHTTISGAPCMIDCSFTHCHVTASMRNGVIENRVLRNATIDASVVEADDAVRVDEWPAGNPRYSTAVIDGRGTVKDLYWGQWVPQEHIDELNEFLATK